MDVRPIMPTSVAGGVRQGDPVRVATPDSARIAAILDTTAQLSQPDVGNLIRILEVLAPPQQASELQDLLRGAVTAAQKGDSSAALKQLTTLIQLDPAGANSLHTEPGLEPIRTQVNQLLTRLEAMSGSDVQGRLAEAAKVLESWGRQPLPGWDMLPQTLLSAAYRLYDTGGSVNYLRAAALAGLIIDRARPPIGSSEPAIATIDTAALFQFSQSDAAKLVAILEPPTLPQQPSTLWDLLGAAVSAAQKGDSDGALKQLAEFARLDPARADTLRAEPGLEPIRAQVDQLLTRLESMAGMDAQTRLNLAATALQSWGRQPLPGWDTAPQTLLTAANRLYDSGGYVNYLHAASIAEVVVKGANPPSTRSTADITALMRLASSLQLSRPDTAKLIRILEPPGLPQEPQDLLRGAVSAAQKGDPGGALKQLEQLVRLDPNRANTLRTEPGLEAIRAQVDQLLTRMESIARTHAQAQLADAGKVLESWGRQSLPGWDTAPQTVLAAAIQLCDAGGYVNCIYAASLARVVIAGARFPIAANRPRPAASPRKSALPSRFGPWLKALWARAPLLILLLSWFVFGLAAIGFAAILHYLWPGDYPSTIIDTGFAIWGIGLLALIAFGFYARVRRSRFR